MTLAETFDTHIKAISTEQEWDKYKAMIMSNEEQIAEEIVEELRMPKSVRNNKRQEIQMVASMIKEHKSEALQELKERVEKKSVYFPSTDSKFLTENDVIETIEDMRDEQSD